MEKQKLSYRIYRPEGPVKAALFCVHGMQEHKQRYDEFAQFLNENQYGCVTFDLPGHGETGGRDNQGYFSEGGYTNLISAVTEILEVTKQTFPQVPVLYFGHSMGTILGRVYLQKHDACIDGCILSGIPAYQSASRVGVIVAKAVNLVEGNKKRSKLLENLATGSFNKQIRNPETDVDWLSYNKANVQDYLNDEMCGIPFTNQGYLELFKMMKQMGSLSAYQCMNSKLPIYIFAGEDDPCIGGKKGFQKSVSLLRQAGYENITTKLFSHMRHETLHEEQRIEVMQAVIDWLNKNIT